MLTTITHEDLLVVTDGSDGLIVIESGDSLVTLSEIGQPGPQGARGPTGPQGTAGAGSSLTLTASGPIGGHRLVMTDGSGGALYADATDPTHRGRIVGLTTGAANDGEPVEVQVSGEIEEISWNWSLGEVFAGVNGVPTQTPPTAGFLQVIGTALTATRLAITIHPPILLI